MDVETRANQAGDEGGKTRVLCVEDEWAIAELLRMSIDAEPDLEAVGTVPRADEMRGRITELRPHVVVVDLTLPGADPLTLVREFADAAGNGSGNGGPRFVVYSGYDDAQTIDRVRAAGALGFVSKRHDVDTLLDCVRRVASGERVEKP